MPLSYQVLGQPDSDNALFVKYDSGQAQTRFLFDCGDGCPHQLGAAEVTEVDHLCLSHCHMDHISGFDFFFRLNFDRTVKSNQIWLPHGSCDIIHHRCRGFMWNLVDEKQRGEWFVNEVRERSVTTTRLLAKERFAVVHAHAERLLPDPIILHGEGFRLEAILLDHGTPSVGYLLRENPRVNIDTAKLNTMGLKPGVWLKFLRDANTAETDTLEVQGKTYLLAVLRKELLVTTPGDSIAYLTDFRMTEATMEVLSSWLAGVNTVVCECQYRDSDAELADAVMHSTTCEVATMAAKAGIGRLILFHFSGRYDAHARNEMLAETRAIFSRTELPLGW